MQNRIKKETLLKNSLGQYRYLFNWNEGGGNDVWAKNVSEARKTVKRDYKSLTIDESTLRRCTQSESKSWDKMWDMMCY
jgi:hypothetical protein